MFNNGVFTIKAFRQIEAIFNAAGRSLPLTIGLFVDGDVGLNCHWHIQRIDPVADYPKLLYKSELVDTSIVMIAKAINNAYAKLVRHNRVSYRSLRDSIMMQYGEQDLGGLPFEILFDTGSACLNRNPNGPVVSVGGLQDAFDIAFKEHIGWPSKPSHNHEIDDCFYFACPPWVSGEEIDYCLEENYSFDIISDRLVSRNGQTIHFTDCEFDTLIVSY